MIREFENKVFIDYRHERQHRWRARTNMREVRTSLLPHLRDIAETELVQEITKRCVVNVQILDPKLIFALLVSRPDWSTYILDGLG